MSHQTEPTKYYVVSLPTREHLDQAYVATGSTDPKTTYYITDDPSKAHDFADKYAADAMLDELRGKVAEEDKTYHLVDPHPKRLWRVGHEV